jgi:selenium-binding protein 1
VPASCTQLTRPPPTRQAPTLPRPCWDPIFYPDGVGAWLAKLDANLDGGGLAADPGFFPNGDDFRGLRVHQTRLQGGDASSDSYCHTS